MTVQIHSIAPAQGPTSGGDLVRLMGSGFGPEVQVTFGGELAEVLSAFSLDDVDVLDVRTPPHGEGAVDVRVLPLDSQGVPDLGAEAVLVDGYQFVRPDLVQEAAVTRIVRALLRMLKAQVLANTSLTTAVDYGDVFTDEARIVPLAELPSVVLTGPTVRASRFYATNVPVERAVVGASGPEWVRHRPALTVDLVFSLTGAAERMAELLNLMAAMASFLNRNRWITLLRNPATPEAGTVRWEMDPEGDFQTALAGAGDVRAFTCGLVIRGVDLDEGLPMDLGKAVAAAGADLTLTTHDGGGA